MLENPAENKLHSTPPPRNLEQQADPDRDEAEICLLGTEVNGAINFSAAD